MSVPEIVPVFKYEFLDILKRHNLSPHKLQCYGCQTPLERNTVGMMIENENELKIFCRQSSCILDHLLEEDDAEEP